MNVKAGLVRHLVLVYDSVVTQKLTLYVNGVAVAAARTLTAQSRSGGNMVMFADVGTAGRSSTA